MLFAAAPARRALLELPVGANRASARTLAVNVWRNHALEPLLPVLEVHAAWGRWVPRWQFGPYDDTLALADLPAADAELVWLDRSRLRLDGGAPAVAAWLTDRLAALRQRSAAPIVLATWAVDAEERARIEALCAELPAVHFADLQAAADEAGVPLTDARLAALAGTPLSAAAQVVVARRLACHWLPGAALPPVKAVAFDLDHTLHAGVLGEDGIEGVQLTPAHAALQRKALALRERGVFLALVSRNEPVDVTALFERRADYPLRLAHFSAVEVGWGDKAEALERIAARLRIGLDALAFVDDNPGELAAVAARCPALPFVAAQPDAALTQRALEHLPGLWRWTVGADDAKRVADLASNVERERLAAVDPEVYFRELQITLEVKRDDASLLPRLAELTRKTNQFNLGLARLSEAVIAGAMRAAQAGTAGVAAVALRDRLSDSGVVALVVAEREGADLVVRELCVSCRALGRRLEDALVLRALAGMAAFEGCHKVLFEVAEGPRNAPAREWLARLLGRATLPAAGRHALPAERVSSFVAPEGVHILEAQHEPC